MPSKKRPAKHKAIPLPAEGQAPPEPEQNSLSGPQAVYSFALLDGSVPFDDWLNALRDRAAKARVILRVRRIVTTGNFGDHKSVGEGVWELRIDYGPGYRLYFGRVNQRIILLLIGGDKSEQDSDIIIAKRWWRSFKERAEKGEGYDNGSLGQRFE